MTKAILPNGSATEWDERLRTVGAAMVEEDGVTPFADGRMDRVIERLVNRHLDTYRQDRGALGALVTAEVKRAVAAQIDSGLELDIKVKTLKKDW